MRFPMKHHISSTFSVLCLIIVVTLVWNVLQLLVSQLSARKCVYVLLLGPDREVLHVTGITTVLTIIVHVMGICPQLLQFGLCEWLKSLTFVTIDTLAQLRSHLIRYLYFWLFYYSKINRNLFCTMGFWGFGVLLLFSDKRHITIIIPVSSFGVPI